MLPKNGQLSNVTVPNEPKLHNRVVKLQNKFKLRKTHLLLLLLCYKSSSEHYTVL
jgi:hypothetical protein